MTPEVVLKVGLFVQKTTLLISGSIGDCDGPSVMAFLLERGFTMSRRREVGVDGQVFWFRTSQITHEVRSVFRLRVGKWNARESNTLA